MNTITFLGTGTSTGVPQIRCSCPTCSSNDPHDKRLRASALINYKDKNILIDCGPDFRTQMLSVGSPDLNAVLLTHSHYDHVGGLDDLRPYCADSLFPIYCRQDVSDDLHARLPYCFNVGLKPGVPHYDIHVIDPSRSFDIDDIQVTPLPVMHAKLPILGYRIGSLAYITDCKTMPESTIDLIKNIDTLVINALRPTPHFSHLSLTQALDLIKIINPRRAFLTHMSHGTPPHAIARTLLPDNVSFAHDMLSITFPD